MERWVLYALLSMLFAGFTSVLAKNGLNGISGEMGLFIRTLFVFAFVVGFACLSISIGEFQTLTKHNLGWLALSGVTTTVSWVFYYKALKDGEVSTISLIDKGSFIVAVLLAWLFLGEQITWRIVVGIVLILSGLLVVAKR